MEDEYPSAAEQYGFSLCHDVVRKLVDDQGLDPKEVGQGILTAAVHCMSKSMTYEQIAVVLYECADGNATREKFGED